MNISAIFIRRPIATILLSVALAASGLFAYQFLPVAALPQVDFPVISVSAQLPGAAPDTMANAVATPLIKQFATIPSVSTISATRARPASPSNSSWTGTSTRPPPTSKPPSRGRCGNCRRT